MLNQDIEKVLISEEELQEKIKALGAELTDAYQDKFPLAIGVLKGAMPFMAICASASMPIWKWTSWMCPATAAPLSLQER